MIGYKISTAMANGAQSTNNKSQSRNVVIVYFLLILLKLTKILTQFRKNGQIGYLMAKHEVEIKREENPKHYLTTVLGIAAGNLLSISLLSN